MPAISKKQLEPKGSSNRKNKAFFPLQVPIYVGPISVWVFLFVVAPLAIILYFSFLTTDSAGRIAYTFTLDAYKNILTSAYGMILIKSLVYAAVNTLFCLLLGYPVAYYIARYGGRWKILIVFLIVIPSWTAYLIRLYAFKTLAARSGLINSLLIKLNIISSPLDMLYSTETVIVGLVYTWLPFMILPLYASLEGFNPSLWEAAKDLGAKPFRTMFRVTIPLTKGGIIAGTIFVFIPSLGDYLVPHLLGGSKVMMVGNLIHHKFIKLGDITMGSSLAVMLTAILVLIIYLLFKMGADEALERML